MRATCVYAYLLPKPLHPLRPLHSLPLFFRVFPPPCAFSAAPPCPFPPVFRLSLFIPPLSLSPSLSLVSFSCLFPFYRGRPLARVAGMSKQRITNSIDDSLPPLCNSRARRADDYREAHDDATWSSCKDPSLFPSLPSQSLSLSLSLSLSVTFRGNFRFRLAALPLASIQTGSKERDLSRRGQLTTRARRDAYVAPADQSVQGYRLLPRRDALTARHRHRHRRRRPAHAADRNAQTRISPRWRRYVYPPPRNVPVAIPAPTPTLHPSTASASPKLSILSHPFRSLLNP